MTCFEDYIKGPFCFQGPKREKAIKDYYNCKQNAQKLKQKKIMWDVNVFFASSEALPLWGKEIVLSVKLRENLALNYLPMAIWSIKRKSQKRYLIGIYAAQHIVKFLLVLHQRLHKIKRSTFDSGNRPRLKCELRSPLMVTHFPNSSSCLRPLPLCVEGDKCG